jgi:cell wall-associated NlpC family hydrolase
VLTEQQKNIVAYAREALGTPFQHQGRICGLALDCAGLAAHVATRLGMPFNEWPGYGRTPHDGLLESVMKAQPCLKEVNDLQPGDLVLMKFVKEPQHVAIYAGETIIHSYESVGRVVEHRLDATWLSRITHTFRFKG